MEISSTDDLTGLADQTSGAHAVGNTSSLLGNLAKRVKNIDGKILGKDGKPLKVMQHVKVHDNTTVPESFVGMEGNSSDTKGELNAADLDNTETSFVVQGWK